MDDIQILRNIDSKLSALLALTALSFSGEAENPRLELLLKQNGIGVNDIAAILSMQEAAVRKAIQRAK